MMVRFAHSILVSLLIIGFFLAVTPDKGGMLHQAGAAAQAASTMPQGMGTLTRISLPVSALPFHMPPLNVTAQFLSADISDDGRYLVFAPYYPTYQSSSVASVNPELFVIDRVRHTTTNLAGRIPLPAGAAGMPIGPVSVSGNGEKIAFSVSYQVGSTYFADFYLYDATTDQLTALLEGEEAGSGTGQYMEVSADGNYVVLVATGNNTPGDGGNTRMIFRYEVATQSFIRVSNGYNGDTPDGNSGQPSISADGNTIVFSSLARNLDPDDLGGFCGVNNQVGNCNDIFVWKAGGGSQNELISRASNGDVGNLASSEPVITHDGQSVAFISASTNLAPLDGADRDIFLHQLTDGSTRILTHSDEGQYQSLKMSADGRIVVATTWGDILPGIIDYYGCTRACGITRDTIKIDTTSGIVTALTPLADGRSAFGSNEVLSLSADGNWLLFNTTAGEFWNHDSPSDLSREEFSDPDLGLLHLPTRTYQRISSLPSAGTNGDSVAPIFAPDGSTIVYSSIASNLFGSPSNLLSYDSINRENSAVAEDTLRQMGVLYGNYLFTNFRFTPDGKGLSFQWRSPLDGESTAAGIDLVTGDYIYGIDGRNATISPNRERMAFQSDFHFPADGIVDTNELDDIYLGSFTSFNQLLISRDSQGRAANGASIQPSFNPDGSSLVYSSRATNIVATDTTTMSDLYLYDFTTNSNRLLLTDTGQGLPNGDSDSPVFAAGGRYMAFVSRATNLVAGDTNLVADVMVYDFETGGIERVSIASDGTQAYGSSINPVITPDGRFVAFVSYADNLVPSDPNGREPDVFLHDRDTGETILLSYLPDGTPLAPNMTDFSISADGQKFLFSSELGLTSDDAPTCDRALEPRQCADIYLWDRAGVAPVTEKLFVPILQR